MGDVGVALHWHSPALPAGMICVHWSTPTPPMYRLTEPTPVHGLALQVWKSEHPGVAPCAVAAVGALVTPAAVGDLVTPAAVGPLVAPAAVGALVPAPAAQLAAQLMGERGVQPVSEVLTCSHTPGIAEGFQPHSQYPDFPDAMFVAQL
tara:strand:+ start:1293 stop:1739 length:447 start_codon:yes stop_codon:yes gene_type:complete